VEIRELEIVEAAVPDLQFRATVSAGTYLRSLARDIGAKLGCGAHLTMLRRTAVGPLRLEDAVAPEAVTPAVLQDAAVLVAHMPQRQVDKKERDAVVHGRPIPSGQTADGNAQERVMSLAWSEVGRRVAENKGGTDHGTAGLSFCVGRAVRGGFYGDYPDLSTLDRNGNMKYTVDFRSLYATVLERWLGQDSAATDTMLGATYPRLGFL